MADRYWRGGTAAWDGTAGTKWAATAGGPTGAAVPTSADDVFFDATSTGTCTISTGNTGAKSINCTGFTGTLAGTAAITVSGSVTLVAGMTVTYSGTLTLDATGTLTTAGKTIGPLTINGSGITVTLGDALTSSGTITVTQGTFTTSASNYSVTAGTFSSSGSTTRSIVLNGSTVTLSNSSPINFATNTNLTFNAGTSSISFTSTASGLTITGGAVSGSGVTFYNATFTSTSVATHSIQSINTFNNLTVTAPSAAGVTQVTFDSRQTINGTLSTTGTAGNRRVWFRGVTYGLAQTLTINATPSLTDADFRDIYVVGTAAPISGTRVGNLRGCRGITFDTPKTVYWNQAAGGNWTDNAWAPSSGGTVNTNNFPLAQDTATFVNTGLNTSATVTMDTALPYTGTVDMSGRTNAMTLSVGAFTIYGDWKNGSGTAIAGSGTLTFSGRNTQTITSAGKTFGTPVNIAVDSYGGSVELADALNIGGNTLTVTNGTFDTKNFNVTASALSSNNSNVRAITLGSSTVTLSASASVIALQTSTNLTLSAGTSQINLTSTANTVFDGGGQTYYNVSFTDSTARVRGINGSNTFNSLTVTAPASTNLMTLSLGANQTITGTLTVAGASPVRRIFVRSDTLGTPRTLTVGTLSATDCDFRDITIAGTAAGSSPTRAGDCGGNSGITFPAAKTVYWNLAGAQNWSATAWAPGSGGTPDINNFPLAQDTAKFDNTGSVTGTITIDAACNIGTFDASARTSAMTLTTSTNAPLVYGDWKFGTGVTSSSTTGTITFAKRGTQTITSNGVTFGCPVTVDSVSGTVQLADALSLGSTRTLTLTSGTFDAVSYNVTTGLFALTGGTLKMGSGTWTLSGTGTVWSMGTPAAFYKGSANIVLSNTSTSARTFDGGGLSYNKLTIGGTTGNSTLTITGNNQFTELASTKTVGHTIALGATTQTFGKWTVTGASGAVVTLTGTGTNHVIAGPAADVDYLAMGSIGFADTSPGEFFAGNNTTGSAGFPVIRSAKPAGTTKYWVYGTGNWVGGNWAASSNGTPGLTDPYSFDDVVLDYYSSGSGGGVSYTATINATARCKSLTITAPTPGVVTFAGTGALICHGSVTLPATGLTRTYTGAITLSSNSTGLTFTTNGVTLASAITVNGVDCGWSLGSALNIGSEGVIVTNGVFDFATYNLTLGAFSSNNANSRTIDFDTGTTTLSGATPINFGTTETNRANLTVTASTSQINCSTTSPTFSGNNQTFYNVSFTSTSAGTVTLNGTNSFNNLSFTGITAAGLKNIVLSANQTVTGTLTFSAGTNATMRHFCRSDTIGTTRTIAAAAVSMTDVDFRDITIAGSAAPASGTRIGDCKGNSGITFTGATTRYWNLAGSNNWSATGWAANAGDAPAVNNFPLAQDTAVFTSTSPGTGTTTTINQSYNIGTIDMSARTTNTMTLAMGSTAPFIYGNWINGTGTTLTGTGTLTFAGRTTQQLTNAGKSFPGVNFTVATIGGSLVLQDAFTHNSTLFITNGTFDANVYNVSITGGVSSNVSSARTIAVGSGTWTLTTDWNCATSTNLTVTGTGTISLTSASAKTFAGGSIAYTNITLNQGGAGTLTISGNNTFKTISNTSGVANTISIGTTTQTITTSWTAAGTSGNVQTVTGTSATSPGTLVFTGSGLAANVDYLTIIGVRAYNLDTTWYAGANSTNNGSLGWIFASSGGGTTYNVFFSDTVTGADAVATTLTLNASFSDLATGLDSVSAAATLNVDFSDTATASDSISGGIFYSCDFADTITVSDTVDGSLLYTGSIDESATGADALSATAIFSAEIAETSTGTDAADVAASVFGAIISELATGQDIVDALAGFSAAVLESATGSDDTAAVLVIPSFFSDTVTASDAPAVAASTFNPSFSDTASGSDALSALVDFQSAVDESAVGSDALSAQMVFVSSVSETASGLDAFEVAASIFNPDVSELATGQDTASVAASTFGASLSDTATVSDAPAASLVLPASFSDTATAADALAAQMVFVTAVDETATGSDALDALVIFISSVNEAASGLDTPSVAASIFNVSLSELASGLDAVDAAGSVFNVSFSDAGAIADLVVGGYLWNPIDDTQAANWQNVQNAQAPGWVEVNATQSPGWQNVVTTQVPGWTDINDSQSPGWVQIQT